MGKTIRKAVTDIDTYTGMYDVKISCDEKQKQELDKLCATLCSWACEPSPSEEHMYKDINTIRTICRNLKDSKIVIMGTNSNQLEQEKRTLAVELDNNNVHTFYGKIILKDGVSSVLVKYDSKNENKINITHNVKDFNEGLDLHEELNDAEIELVRALSEIITLDIERDMDNHLFLQFITKVYREAYNQDPDFTSIIISQEIENLFNKIEKEKGIRLYAKYRGIQVEYKPEHPYSRMSIPHTTTYDCSDLNTLRKYGVVTEPIDKYTELGFYSLINEDSLDDVIKETGKQIIKENKEWENDNK